MYNLTITEHIDQIILSEIFKMRITANLNKKISQAVRTSMQIEGYRSNPPPSIKEQVKALMEQHRVQVSVHRK